MSCPVCLGYDFALEDKRRLQELEPIESRLFCHKNTDQPSMNASKLKALKDQGLTMTRERRELVCARQVEMGYRPDDVDKLVREWKEQYFEGVDDGDGSE